MTFKCEWQHKSTQVLGQSQVLELRLTREDHEWWGFSHSPITFIPLTRSLFSLQVLLFDLPAPTLQPQEKLLIDLTNTPDLIRTITKSCTATQVTAASPGSIHELKVECFFLGFRTCLEELLNKTCLFQQLIDLSSPLIKWSPEDKRENNAPLINLSFWSAWLLSVIIIITIH